MKHTSRAFSLLEVAVAAALAGVVAAAAVSAFAVLNRQLVRLQAETRASDDAKTLIDFIVGDLQAVGGGAVRPWMALWVEDGADAASATRCVNFNQAPCGTSDRMTMAIVVPNTETCPIVSMTNATLTTTGTGLGCCFSEVFDEKGGFTDPLDGELRMHVILTNGSRNRQVSLSTLDNITCTMKWAAGPLAGVDNVDGDTLFDPIDPDAAAVLPSVFDGGSISAVGVQTLYLDETAHELRSFRDLRDFNGAAIHISSSESKRIASDVYDLQFQLGYDGDPADGRLVDLGTNSDEWLYNTTGVDTLPATVNLRDLRMSAVGLIVGVDVKDPNYVSGVQIVGSTPKSAAGIHMRPGMGKAALRNIFVFF